MRLMKRLLLYFLMVNTMMPSFMVPSLVDVETLMMIGLSYGIDAIRMFGYLCKVRRSAVGSAPWALFPGGSLTTLESPLALCL